MVKTYNSAWNFLAASLPLLLEKEAENNLILGIAETLQRDIKYYGDQPPLLISVHLDDRCICCCLQTPPKNLIIYADEGQLNRSIPELCNYLAVNNVEIPGIIGPRDTVLQFNDRWTSIKQVSATVRFNQMVYKLEKLTEVPMSPGKMRQALPIDLDTVTDWIHQFHLEALGQSSFEEARKQADKKIQEGAIYLWETDQPVSMAGWTRPTQNGVTIAFVYTPEEHRKKGYATSCVAQLTKLMLEQYRFCSLFTDLNNPTSNSIYQKMGYQPKGHVLQCAFD